MHSFYLLQSVCFARFGHPQDGAHTPRSAAQQAVKRRTLQPAHGTVRDGLFSALRSVGGRTFGAARVALTIAAMAVVAGATFSAKASSTAVSAGPAGLVAAALPAAGTAAGANARAVAVSKPNIVLVVVDDWAFADVGAFGGEIATPHLDALAYRGTRFTNFHVAASCAPTRAMLLTGVEHHRAGVGNLRETMPRAHRGQPGYLGSLNTHVVTVASLLRDGGYRTYIAGKWNVGSEPHNLPDQRGFDRSIIQGDTGSDNWDPKQRYLPHSAKVDWFEDGKTAQMPERFYTSEYFVDRALGYLRQDAGSTKPFFAYLGFQANHVPLQAPRALVEKYRGRYQKGWDVLRAERRDRIGAMGLLSPNAPMAPMPTTEDWNALTPAQRAYQERRMEVYAAMAEAMDFHLGRFIQHLRDQGQFDNTVFVFLSDNGAEGSDYREAQPWLRTQYSQDIDRLGEPGAYAILGPSWASAISAPFYSYKFYAGEGGLRSPMIISGVPGSKPGALQHSLTHVTDIAPTLLELAGVQVPQGVYQGRAVEPMSGRSLAPLLAGRSSAVRTDAEPLGYELSGNQAVFRGTMKLVKNLAPFGDGQWSLYDLAADPGETRDLKLEQPALFATMQKDYADFAQSHGVLPMPAGYDPIRQVLINSMLNYWIPTYWPHGLAFCLLLTGALVHWRKRRRRWVAAAPQ